MRTITAGIEHSGELHKLYSEYAKDSNIELPNPRMWIHKFSNPSFYCLLFKHGKRPVGFVMGEMQEYYDKPKAELGTVFVRRQFRGKLKFIRALILGVKKFYSTFQISSVSYNRVKPKERGL
jgi:Acetyltransferase (GNAT) family